MKHLWQRLINKIARKLKLYGTLDSEKAIRVLKRENLALKQELAQQQPHAWIDATMRQRGYAQSAWNAEPERITEKPTIIPHPRGQYAKLRLPEFRKTELMPIVERPDGFLL